MAKCSWNYDADCQATATTTLKRNNGQIEQLCEFHANLLTILLKAVAAGLIPTKREDGENEATHWLVQNKIPS